MYIYHMGRRSTSKRFAGEVVLLGVESSGKTLLCRHLERVCASQGGKGKAAATPPLSTVTQPSVGIEQLEVTHGSRVIALREVGGNMQPLWQRYISTAAAVLFVADTACAEGAASAVVELLDVLRQAKNTRVLLLLNKRELPTALPEETVRLLFDLDALEDACDGQLKVIWGSALVGDVLPGILAWCADSLAEREELVAALAEAEANQAAAKEKAAKQTADINSEIDAKASGNVRKKRSFSLRRRSSSNQVAIE